MSEDIQRHLSFANPEDPPNLPATLSPSTSKGDKKKLRIVIKIGTSSILDTIDGGETSLALVHLATTVAVLCELRQQGHDVVLVSSGAVGAGCHNMGLTERPSSMVTRQALAAIGQVHLMGKYENLFNTLGHKSAQVLLTYENFVDRVQFLNAKNTFNELFKFEDVIPIVNENDTVGIHYLKANNDKLAGMVGNMIEADLVFMMTDVDGVYTANPHNDPNAKRIKWVRDIDELERMCKLGDGEDSNWGTGGMAAKISAASLSASLGVRTIIMHADNAERIKEYVAKEIEEGLNGELGPERFDFGTTFERNPDPPRERTRWIRSLHKRGTITVDANAVFSIANRKTLFAIGVVDVSGSFTAFEAVSIRDEQGNEIASGLCNFSSDEIKQIRGMNSDQVFELFGQSAEVVERENMDVQIDQPSENAKPPAQQQEAGRQRSNSFGSQLSQSSFVPPSKRPSTNILPQVRT